MMQVAVYLTSHANTIGYMGIKMQFVDILIFAVIAVFLIMRLRSILGNRDGFEQDQTKNNAFQTGEQPENAQNIIPLRSDQNNGVGLDAVRRADKSFSDDGFAQGAASAFSMILTAFAEGDLASLRRLLGYDLNEEFTHSINQRIKSGDELEITIHDIQDVELMDGEVTDNIASVTVKFTSKQSRILKDKQGDEIEDETFTETEMVDIWVFERDISLSDPNWKLVETRAEDNE